MRVIRRFVLFSGIRLCVISFIPNVLLILPKLQSSNVIKFVKKSEKFGAPSKCSVFNVLNVNAMKLCNFTISIAKDVRLTAKK